MTTRSQTQSPPPFDPYAPRGNGVVGDLRERLAVLETKGEETSRTLASHAQRIERLSDRQLRTETAGAAALNELPRLLESFTQPLDARVRKLETRWWEPMRPYFWRVYAALGLLGFALGWKFVTGEPLPMGQVIKMLFTGS